MYEPSSANVKLSGSSIVGASFTGVTVKANTALSVYSPSVTDTLIFTSPLKFSDGVKMRFAISITSTSTLTSPGLSLAAVMFKISPSTSPA